MRKSEAFGLLVIIKRLLDSGHAQLLESMQMQLRVLKKKSALI